MFQCPFCPYKAKQKGNLGVHLRKHHSQDGSQDGRSNPDESVETKLPD